FEGGHKLGLGSSAAVATALAAALAAAGGIRPDRELLFDLASSAHRTAQGGTGSGGDVAASVYGGLLFYTRGDAMPPGAMPPGAMPPAAVPGATTATDPAGATAATGSTEDPVASVASAASPGGRPTISPAGWPEGLALLTIVTGTGA